MMIPDRIRSWFIRCPERPTLFLLGLTFSSSLVDYVLAVLVIYLIVMRNIELEKAASIISFQKGAARIMHIFMAFLKDAYIGHYWMAIISSVIYSIGLGLLSRDDFSVYKAIIILALAKAGHEISFEDIWNDKVGVIMKPDDKAQTKPITCTCFTFQIHKRQRLYQRFFIRSLFTVFSMAGAGTGVYGIYRYDTNKICDSKICDSKIYDSNKIYQIAYILAVGPLILLLGFPFYGFAQPQGFKLSNPLRVFVTAMLKRHLYHRQNDTQLYHGHTDQETQGHQHRVRLTNRLRFLNKAAIIDPNKHDFSVEERRWRLCSVKEVEDAKRLLVWIPMSATFVLYGMIFANADTFFINQAYFTNGSVGNIKSVPLATLYLASEHTKLILTYLCKRLFKRFKTRRRYLNSMISIGLGLFTACCCFIVAALVKAKRLKTSEVSMFWLTPQFLLMGIMEGFARSGMQDFLCCQFPTFMKRHAGVFVHFVIGLGKLLNIVFLIIVGKVGKSWFGIHVDYFYYVLAALGMVNFLVYVYLATRNSCRNAEITEEEE